MIKYSWQLTLAISVTLFLHSVTEIAVHNIPTRLPWWLVTQQNWLGLPEVFPFKIWDGYHFVKGLNWILAFIGGGWGLGTMISANVSWTKIIIWFIFSLLIGWQMFNIGFHWLWRLEPNSPWIWL